MLRSPHVHCELGPVLVNRTAVYKMCRMIPGELRRRGFEVTCSALLSRVHAHDAGPANAREARLFRRSQKWLSWAIRQPEVFKRVRGLTGLVPRWRHRGDVRLFLDAVYTLFYGAPERGVVIVYDISPVAERSWPPRGVDRLYDLTFSLLARSRCHIVTSCQNTADQLRVNWGIAPSRLTVLPLGLFSFPGTESLPRKPAAAPFFLFVGTLEPRKNVEGLIRAYAASGLFKARGIRLRLVGMKPDDHHPLVALARATPGVDLPGFVSDSELAAAYAECLGFVYPSFCEGFGLPLLEAMHHGCVCLSTITGASPAVAGDAALSLDPYDHSAIATSLRRLAQMPATEQRRLSERARARADQFTWKRFHDGLTDVLHAACVA